MMGHLTTTTTTTKNTAAAANTVHKEIAVSVCSSTSMVRQC